MTRMFVCLITLALLLVALPLAAQEFPTDQYVVSEGDTLWDLAEVYQGNPLLWQRLVDRNPFLKQPGRVVERGGKIYVLIRPGEILEGLQELGIMPPTPIPINEVLPQPVTVEKVPDWVWWLLALLILIILVGNLWYLVQRMLTTDPVSSRPAMVQGGVNEANAITAMQQVAARAAGHNPGISRDPSTYQQFTVIRQTAGRIWGNMTVRYADNRSVPRRLNGDRAYQAEVLFPDGRTETLYMLQGCGNDLRYGGISRYLPGPEFRFEADPAVQPVAPATELAAQPEPAPTLEPVVAPAPAANRSSLTFEMKRSTNGEPHLVRFDSDQIEEFFIGRDRRITIRYREAEGEPAPASK